MTYEEALWVVQMMVERDAKTEAESDAMNKAIEALEKQSEVVHCKDCKNWITTTIDTIDGRTAEVGRCELTKRLCGEQGYCMYGKEVE